MKTQASDHRKGCQCQTCVRIRGRSGEDIAATQRDYEKRADAAQGGVTTNPDGSIAYRHVSIVEEKPRG